MELKQIINVIKSKDEQKEKKKPKPSYKSLFKLPKKKYK